MDIKDVPAGTVVVGVDGSANSEHALAWAGEQAHLEHRGLTLVHAIGPSGAAWAEAYGMDHGLLLDAMRSEGQLILDRACTLAEQSHPGLEVHGVLRLTDPRIALMELSERAAMVVVGSRGRGPVRRLVLGSVSVAVARHSSCPVVLIRPHDRGAERHGVLVGIDFTERSNPALEFAFRQASQRALPLTVMHCFWDVTAAFKGMGPVGDDEPGVEAERLQLSQAVGGLPERFPDVQLTLKLVRGLADDCLVRAARRMDMVVVGVHTTRSLLGFFDGQVDRAVVGHAPCVVAVVPSGARRLAPAQETRLT